MSSTLFRLGPVPVRSYGLMMALAFVAGIALAARRGRQAGVRPEVIVDLGLISLLLGVAVARLTFVALDPALGWRDFPYLWTGGLSFHGGMAGAIAGCWLYVRWRRLDFWALADVVAPSVALGYAIARLGCFLNGCCYGLPAALPWACRFPDEQRGGLTPPSHPTQLYASLGSLAMLGLLLILAPRLRVRGQLFTAYLGLYGVLRFVVEIFRRGASAQVLWGGLTLAQFVSLALILGAGAAAWALERRAHRAPGGAPGGGRAAV